MMKNENTDEYNVKDGYTDEYNVKDGYKSDKYRLMNTKNLYRRRYMI